MKAHRIDYWSLLAGLVLAGAGLLILIPASSTQVVLNLDGFFDFIFPVLALVLGAALVIPALRRKDQPQPPTPLTESEKGALEELNQSAPPMA